MGTSFDLKPSSFPPNIISQIVFVETTQRLSISLWWSTAARAGSKSRSGKLRPGIWHFLENALIGLFFKKSPLKNAKNKALDQERV